MEESVVIFFKHIQHLVFLLCAGGPLTALGEDYYEALETAQGTYHEARVLSVSQRSLSIAHREGLTQVMLSDLPAELQRKYNYNPLLAQVYAAAQVDRAPTKDEKVETPAPSRKTPSRLRNFWPTTEAPLQKEVDLRQRFQELGLTIKHQGGQLTCSIHAMVTLAEFEYANHYHDEIEYSEGFILWELRTYDDRNAANAVLGTGIKLTDVANRITTLGLAEEGVYQQYVDRSSVTREDLEKEDFILPAPPQAYANALQHRNVNITQLVGGGRDERFLNQVLHALNEGHPVVIGSSWPHYRTIATTNLLDKQSAPFAHAVTLIGYRSDGQNRDSLRFIFRNSWGVRWGVGGHGFMTLDFFRRNVFQGFTLQFYD